MFAKLWEEDRLAKERREAQDEKRQRELVQNTRLGLDAQVTSIHAQREAARRMKEEEARALVSPFKRPVVTGFTGAVVFPLVKRVCLECGAGLLSSFSRLKSHLCLVIDTQKCIEGQARSAWRRINIRHWDQRSKIVSFYTFLRGHFWTTHLLNPHFTTTRTAISTKPYC